MADPVPWTCPGCQQPRVTPYCAQCGEEPAQPHEWAGLGGLDAPVVDTC